MKAKMLIMGTVGFIAAATVVALLTAAEQEAKEQAAQAQQQVQQIAGETGPAPVLKKELTITRGLSKVERECIACHAKETPGMIRDWSLSLHGRANVTCLDCHKAEATDKDARDCPGTEKYTDLKITPVVTPKDCAKCHPQEEEQFSKSKHARTLQIIQEGIQDPWMKGMNNDVERATGCNTCHGSDISDGKLTELNWPNEGTGRANPDGSFGSCVTCHTNHMFSIAEARKPETCGQCHMGPDHPQEEIYFESKHGKRYLADGHKWNFETTPDLWEPGNDYTAPTCATCHMSGIGPLATSHQLSVRLKWESQAPLNIPNKDLDGDKEREDMKVVCKQCHSSRWGANHLARYDMACDNYNNNYFKPVKAKMEELYEKGLIKKWPMFDEEIEIVFYEFWHHEGRRARMGSAMMAPDYAWWHGFYELKHSYQKFFKLAKEIEEKGHGSPTFIPGTGGTNLTPAKLTPPNDIWRKNDKLIGKPKNL